MAEWIKQHPLPVFFMVMLTVGLMLISAAAFTQGAFWGLLVTGILTVAAGHWVTYLKTIGGSR